MRNQSMARKLSKQEAIDVETIGVPWGTDGKVWQLSVFEDDVDYCVGSSEEWIWSIGIDADGRILAATDSRFYGSPAYTCVWLR